MHYLNEFQEWLRSEGKGALTIDEYVRAVKGLVEWYEGTEGDFVPKEVTGRHLQSYREYLQTRKNKITGEVMKPATINKRISAIKVYWSFLVDKGIVEIDVSRKVKVKRVSRLTEAPRWLTKREVGKVLHAIEMEKNEWRRARNRAMVMFMLKAGLRISEVRDLDLLAVDERYERVTITAGKGGKWRIVPMNTDLLNAYREWMKKRGEMERVETDRLFVTSKGKPLTRQAIHQQLGKYFEVLGDKEVSPHCLRHTFCKDLIDQGISLQTVGDLAGHESIETTRRYTTPSEKELRAAVELISEER